MKRFWVLLACLTAGCSSAAYNAGGGGTTDKSQGLLVTYERQPAPPVIVTIPTSQPVTVRSPAVEVARTATAVVVSIPSEPSVRQSYTLTPEEHTGDAYLGARVMSWVPESPGAVARTIADQRTSRTMNPMPSVAITDRGIEAAQGGGSKNMESNSALAEWWSTAKQWVAGISMTFFWLAIAGVAIFLLPVAFPTVGLFAKLKSAVVTMFTWCWGLLHKAVDWIEGLFRKKPAPPAPPTTPSA